MYKKHAKRKVCNKRISKQTNKKKEWCWKRKKGKKTRNGTWSWRVEVNDEEKERGETDENRWKEMSNIRLFNYITNRNRIKKKSIVISANHFALGML